MAVRGHGGCVCWCWNGNKLHVFERGDDLRKEFWQGETQRVGPGHADCGFWVEWDVAESGWESLLRSERRRKKWGCGCIPILPVPGRATVCGGPGGRCGLKGYRRGRDD